MQLPFTAAVQTQVHSDQMSHGTGLWAGTTGNGTVLVQGGSFSEFNLWLPWGKAGCVVKEKAPDPSFYVKIPNFSLQAVN